MADDDDPLFTELGAAVRSGQAVPDRLVEIGKSAFAFRDTAADIAALTQDSTALASTRAQRSAVRSLTFVAGDIAIEVEVTRDALSGQVVPAHADRIEVLTPTGPLTDVAVDDIGWFTVRPAPTGPVRLRLRTTEGTAIDTEWTTL